MKKTILLIVGIVMLLYSCSAIAEDFAALISEKEELCQALWYAEEWDEVLLPTGTYEVGKDIPAGKWTFWAYDYARPQIQYAAKLQKGGASMHANRDVEQHETVESPKRNSFDPALDDSFFDVEMEKGKYICIKYGTAVFNNDRDSQNFDFSHPVDDSILKISASEIRDRINEIDNILKKDEKYQTYIIKAGNWTVGEELPAGIYEVRAEKGNRTQILVYEKGATYDVLLANIYDPTHESYELKDDDTVEYLTLENGMKIEVRETYGNAVFSTYIGKEPLEFVTGAKDEVKESHEWEVKKEKTSQDLMLQLYAAISSFEDDGITLNCSYDYKEKTLYFCYRLTEYTKRDFQDSSGKRMKKQFIEDVKNETYPAMEKRIEKDVGGSLEEYRRDDFDIVMEWQAADGYVLVKIKNGKTVE